MKAVKVDYANICRISELKAHSAGTVERNVTGSSTGRERPVSVISIVHIPYYISSFPWSVFFRRRPICYGYIDEWIHLFLSYFFS